MRLFSEDRPRQHHYVFAHRELLAVARRFAGNMPELAQSGRMDAALTATWNRVGDHLPATDRLPPTGLRASLHDGDGSDIVLIVMPLPEHGAEAYFVAVVVAEARLVDYFVLEHGWTTTDEPRTVLCKWEDQNHVNLGDGPPPDANAFLAAVRARISPGQV
jgi:hypothetical protein